MKWSEENNIKWTTKYRGINLENKEPDFYSTEIWAPDWNTACDKDMSPDIFIKLYYYESVKRLREGLVIAMPNSIYVKNRVLIDSELLNVANKIPNSAISTLTRIWYPSWKFRNRIEDMNPHELQEIVENRK